VIFGSGTAAEVRPPALVRALIDRRIGVETMDTPAACRTYNVLVSEGRGRGWLLLVPNPERGHHRKRPGIPAPVPRGRAAPKLYNRGYVAGGQAMHRQRTASPQRT
jgi:hypothetical protein